MKKFGFPVNLRPLVINLSLSFLVYINDGWNVPLIVCACAIFPKTIKSSKFFPMVLISPFFENCEIFFSVENCQFSENRKIINENQQSRFVVSQKLQWDNRTQNKILKKLVCLPAFQENFHLSFAISRKRFYFLEKSECLCVSKCFLDEIVSRVNSEHNFPGRRCDKMWLENCFCILTK